MKALRLSGLGLVLSLPSQLGRQRAHVSAAGFAVADQTLFSGTNFVLSVILARWLPEQQFGAFAIAYSSYLLIAALHTALTSEPMQVFGAGRYHHVLGRFLVLTFYWHLLVSSVAAALVSIVVVAAVGRDTSLASTLLTMAVSIPALLAYWVARRAFYIRAESRLALQGGIVYLIVTLSGVSALHGAGRLSADVVFPILATASLIATAASLPFLQCRWTRKSDDPSFFTLAKEYVSYGRWSCPTMVVSWVPHNVFYVALPAFAGIEAAGSLRALTNLIMPMQNVLVACSALLLPALAKRYQSGGHPTVLSLCRRAQIILGFAACCHFVALLVLGPTLVAAIYSDRYGSTSLEQMILAAIPIAYVPMLIYDDALRATNRMSQLFRSYAISAAIAVTVGIPLMWSLGLLGAALALLLAAIVSGAAMAYHCHQRTE